MAKKRRRNSSFVDGLNAFASTYKMTRGVMQDRDMSEAAGAKQTEDKGFTVEQGEQLDAVANAKDENGQAFYNVNATEDGKYQVTPNKEVFDARGASADLTNSTANIDPGQRFTFQGKTRDTAFTEAEQDTGRMNAMAGVFSKYGDPVKALDMRQKAGQIEAQGLQKRIAEQGLALGETQISAAKRAEVAGARQESASNAIMEAGQAQATAAAQAPDQSRFLQGIAGSVGVEGVARDVKANPANAGAAKVAGSMGVEAMIRANAGPNATESELQQAMTAYRQSIGDAQANQNAAGMGELYKRQGEIWNNVGGDPVKAAAAYKMAEAEGLPQVIERLKAKDVDGANKIWNSTGQGKGIITQVLQNEKGGMMATMVDPFTGKSQTVSVSDMERQMMSLKDQAGIRASDKAIESADQSIAASKANVIQGEAQTRIAQANAAGAAAERGAARADRAMTKKEKDEYGRTARALYLEQNPNATKAQLDAVENKVLAPFKETKNEYVTSVDSMGITGTRTNKDTGAMDVFDPRTGKITASIQAPGAAAKPVAITPRPEYDKLPKGSKYIGPDGRTYIKK